MAIGDKRKKSNNTAISVGDSSDEEFRLFDSDSSGEDFVEYKSRRGPKSKRKKSKPAKKKQRREKEKGYWSTVDERYSAGGTFRSALFAWTDICEYTGKRFVPYGWDGARFDVHPRYHHDLNRFTRECCTHTLDKKTKMRGSRPPFVPHYIILNLLLLKTTTTTET
jgi:hypothetical protein